MEWPTIEDGYVSFLVPFSDSYMRVPFWFALTAIAAVAALGVLLICLIVSVLAGKRPA
jgi:hypothetical protein